MLHKSNSPLKHVVSPEDDPSNFSAFFGPVATAAPRGWIAPATTSTKRGRDAEDYDDEVSTKRIRSFDPAFDAMDVEPTTTDGSGSAFTSSKRSAFTLPNSQDIGKGSKYNSWSNTGQQCSFLPCLAHRLTALCSQEFSVYCCTGAYVGAKVGAQPSDLVRRDVRFGLALLDEDETGSECSDSTVDDPMQMESRVPSSPLGSKTPMEAAHDKRVAETIAESALAAMGRALCEERPKIWNKPGLSPLGRERAVDNDTEQRTQLLLVARSRRVIEIKRDHAAVDRICARRLVLRTQACLYYDQLPENVRVLSGSAEIAKREMAEMLDEANIEPMPHGMSGKGTSPGPRDTSYERPTLDPPESEFRYTITSGPFIGERIEKTAFNGSKRWAMLVPDLKGKRKAATGTEGDKPSRLSLRIRVLASNDEYEIHTDVLLMTRWKDNGQACHELDIRGWAGHTTFTAMQEWERFAAAAAAEAMQEEPEGGALSPSYLALSLPSAPTSTSTAGPDTDAISVASGETCVLSPDNEDDSMDWSAFIDPALFESAYAANWGLTFA